MAISNTNRVVKNTVFLYIRMAIVMLVSLLTVRVAYNQLGQVDYGVYSVVGGTVFALSFISYVLSSAAVRFFAYDIGENNIEHLKTSFTTIFVSFLVAIGLILVLAETIGLWLVNYKLNMPEGYETVVNWIYQTSLISFVAIVISAPYSAMIVAFEEMNFFALVGIVDVLLKLLAAYLLAFVSNDKLLYYSVFLCIANFGTASFYIIYTIIQHKECKSFLTFDKSLFKSVFSYSSWTMFGSVSGLFTTQGLNVILNIFFGPIVNTAYSVSHQVSSAVNSFGMSFFSAIRPGIIKSYASGDVIYLNRLFNMGNKILAILMLVIVVPLFVEADVILKIWLGEVSGYVVVFTRLVLVYTFIFILSNPITTIIQAANRVKIYHKIVDSFTLVSLPLAYVCFLFKLDASYSYYILIIVFFVAHFLRLFILRKYFSFSIRCYTMNFLLPVVAVAVVTIACSFFVKSLLVGNSIYSTLAVVAFSVALPSVVSLFTLFSVDERGVIYSRIKHRIIY